ncbi:hypothetical protein FACS1894190_02500 [Spirochaetia bacterium]|nr:hypothetical protein FACS1894190_02500 [Spirochaetia bacterium]
MASDLAANSLRHLFIINPISFRHHYSLGFILKKIEDEIAAVPREEWEVHISQYPRDSYFAIIRKTSQLSKDQRLRVYAIGGDGIIFDCLDAIITSPAVDIAIVPYGLSNNFVRVFYNKQTPVNKSTLRNIKLLSTSGTMPFDVFKCNTKYAINNCRIGIEASARNKAISILKPFRSTRAFLTKIYLFTFFIGCILSFFNKKLRMQRYDITIDGIDFSGIYSNISIANSPYSTGTKKAGLNIKPNDGLLNVILCRGSSIIKLLSVWSDYLNGNYDRHKSVFQMIMAKKITIRSREYPIQIILDGNSFIDNHVEIEIINSAIQIVVPKAELAQGKDL